MTADRELPGLSQVDHTATGPHLSITSGGRRSVPRSRPDGRLIVDPGEDKRHRYLGVADDEGYLLRFLGVCDVRVDAELRHATYYVDPGADDDLAGVLLAGTFLAFVLALRGACVLHGSAVEVEGRALAFVGHSGMGKSTLTVAACAGGGRLIAEDVLSIDTTTTPLCLPGPREVRLRRGSLPVAGGLEQHIGPRTADGRFAVHPNMTSLAAVPLDTIVVPRPDRRARRLTVDRMPPTAALFRLLNFPRVLGLNDPEVMRRQFLGVGQIARHTSVKVVTVPWSPFPQDLGHRLVALMRTR